MSRYENWKSLTPLTEPAPIGTQCVCLVDDFCFKAGDVVKAELINEYYDAYHCESEAGELIMFGYELALLPTDG